MKTSFHLALPSIDLQKTINFYTHKLGARLGRSTDTWVDIDLYGNQITFTKSGAFNFDFKNYRLGEHMLPSFHFGVIIDEEKWDKLYLQLYSMNLEVTTEVTFFKDKIGEHLSFFVKDPNGYMVEFKNFKKHKDVFEK